MHATLLETLIYVLGTTKNVLLSVFKQWIIWSSRDL